MTFLIFQTKSIPLLIKYTLRFSLHQTPNTIKLSAKTNVYMYVCGINMITGEIADLIQLGIYLLSNTTHNTINQRLVRTEKILVWL